MAPSLVFSLFFFLLLERSAAQSVPFEGLSLQKWIAKTFLETYTRYQVPSDEAVTAGSQLYSDLKQGDYEGRGTAGSLADLPIDNLNKIVDMWNKNSIISSNTAKELKTILSSSNMFKTIIQTANLRDNGEIVYGTIGLVKLCQKDGVKASVFYSFKRFLLATKPNGVSFAQDEKNCIMWGSICATRFSFGDLSDDNNNDLGSFMLSEAIKQFLSENELYIVYHDKEANRYRPFLPAEVKETLTKLEEKSTERPDAVLESDPLDGNNFDL